MLSRQYLWRALERILTVIGAVFVAEHLGAPTSLLPLLAGAVAVAASAVGRGIGNPESPYLLPQSIDPPALAEVDMEPRPATRP